MSGSVIIYGGRGALGGAIVKHFRAVDWRVVCIDLVENEEADFCITVPKDATLADQTELVMTGLQNELKTDKVDAIINVAGGWAGGNAANKEFIKSCEMMWQQSVWSSIITANAASKFLKPKGLVVLPGAQPALKGTAGMIGYGMAKAAVHQLTKSLGSDKSGLPDGSLAVAILPITLDTPMNRKWMAKADFSTWTSLEYVAELLMKWATHKERPDNGSLVHLVTSDNVTKLVME